MKGDLKKLTFWILFAVLFLVIDAGLILSHNLIAAAGEWSLPIVSSIGLHFQYILQPELQIKFNPQEPRHLCEWVNNRISGHMRRFARADVWNIGDKTAVKCIATLEVLEGPNGFKEQYLEPRPLHWIDKIERQVVPVDLSLIHI